MIYEEHGLTTEIAFNSALKKAGIEITSYIAPQEITTDVICTVDTTKHDEQIRAEEIRKFAEWLCEHNAGIVDADNEEWKIKTIYRGIESVIEEYEKEQKNV